MKKTPLLDQSGKRKFGILDSLSYAAGDFGCNMSFALKGTMAIFWTQFMRMDSVLYAGLLILVQIWDAINDPLIGSTTPLSDLSSTAIRDRPTREASSSLTSGSAPSVFW